MSKAGKVAYSTWRTFGVPILGFGVGWGAYTFVENSSMISERNIQWTHLQNLRAQKYLAELNVLPQFVSSKLLLDSNELNARISMLESILAGDAPSKDDRVPFSQILRECQVEQQVEWLLEHVEEDIPYFFIADLFHSWAEVHEASCTSQPLLPSKSNESFLSPDLCTGVWEKTVSGVLPFDVGVRALTVLAANHKENAKQIFLFRDSEGVAAPLLLQRLYSTYCTERAENPDNTVPRALVDACTVKLFLLMNEVAKKGKRSLLTPWRRPPFPITESLSDTTAWCQCFNDNAVVGRVETVIPAQDAKLFEAMRSQGFHCNVVHASPQS